MKFSAALLVSALAALAKAVILTNTDYTVKEGETFTITWAEASEPVTIKLKNGESGDLKDVTTITSSGTGGSFAWTPSGFTSGTYAFEITDASGSVNYSPQFPYEGTATASATASTASSTGSSTASSSKTSSASETESTTSSARVTSSTMTPITNSTMSTSTHASTSRSSSTATRTSSSSTSTATGVPTSNGQRVASSVALVLGAVAVFIAFN